MLSFYNDIAVLTNKKVIHNKVLYITMTEKGIQHH